jgi:glycolate oxidase iron-sulfur subunit
MFSQTLQEDLYHCLKCGLCQQTCPTFKAVRREYFAPRGRIQIIKRYLEGDIRVSPVFQQAIMSCTLCDACSATCPSGVRIDRVLRMMRGELADALGPGITKKVLFGILQNVSRMRIAARIGRAGQKFLVDELKVARRVGNIPLSRLPRLNKRSFRNSLGGKVAPKGKAAGRVLYFTGCATELFYEDVGYAVVEVLTRLGFEVIVPRDQGCCGAPIFLAGFGRECLPNVRKNLAILDDSGVDAVVVDCATCGSALKKEIPLLLNDLGQDSDQALRVASKVKDVTELVCERLELLEPVEAPASPVTVTYHDPCHLVRGMGVKEEPRRILRSLPHVRLVEMEESSACCGGAGSYQFENVDLSHRITLKKTQSIYASGATIVATGCPGCRLTLTGNLGDAPDVEVLHTAQVLARNLLMTRRIRS